MVQYRRIGELLLENGQITKKQLEQAVRIQLKTGSRFGEVLVAMGAVSEETVTECLSKQYDFPIADLDSLAPEADALEAVGKQFALAHLVLPVRMTPMELTCVVSDPLDVAATDRLSAITGRRLNLMLAPPVKLFDAIRTAYDCDHGLTIQEGRIGEDKRDWRAPGESSKRIRKQRDREALLVAAADVDPEGTKMFWKGMRSR